MRKISIYLFILWLFAGSSFAQPASQSGMISLESLWLRYEYLPAFPGKFTWMRDDQFYSVMEDGGVWRYSIKNEKRVDAVLEFKKLSFKGGIQARDIQSYELSSDEQKALLAAKTESIYRQSSRSVFHVADRSTGKTSLLHEGEKISNPAFSPDGSKVAYVFENNIFMQDLLEGNIHQITHDGKKNHIINGMADWVYEEEFVFTNAFFWSPDSRHIAYIRFDESTVPQFHMPLYGELYPYPETFKYPKAGEENSKVSVHIFDLEDDKTLMADLNNEEEFYIPRMRWRSAEELTLLRMNRLQNNVDLMAVKAASGDSRVLLNEKTDAYFEVSDLTWGMEKWYPLEQSENFLWVSEQSGYYHIYLYDGSGNMIKDLTPGKYEAMNIVSVDEANEKVYYTSTEESPLERHLYSVRFDGKKKRKLTEEPGVHKVTVSSAGNYFVDSYSSYRDPGKTVLADASGKTIKIIEDNKNLKEKVSRLKIREPEFFQFTSASQIPLEGWMIKPPDFDPSRKYPVLMFVYGGPGDQQVINQWGFDDFFNYFWHQMLAQRGYIVACVDNRGTGARGREFRTATYGELGKYETIDQVETAQYLGSLNYVDADRIGIWGWSYGAYMTALCLTKGKGSFKMGIAVAPISNWRFYDTIYTERYLKTPQENPDGYDQNSPINFARDLQGKLLLVHGTGDDNVHFQNTVEMVDALINANKDFDVFFYPNRNHGIYGGITRYHLYSKMTKFIFEHL